MRKQDQLSTLISSLSKSEKRYFKLYASMHTSDKTFIQLFDELIKCNTYKPEELAKKLNISKPLLAHTKKYLEKVLLGSLRLYEQDSDLNLWLRSRWQEVKILLGRSQFELAIAINEKALEKSIAYENFLMAYNFLELKFVLLMCLRRWPESVKISQQKTNSLSQLDEMEYLSNTIIKYFQNVKFKGKKDDELGPDRAALFELFKKGPEKLKSDSARIRWHELRHAYLFVLKKDAKSALYHSRCIINIFEAHPQLVYSLSYSYMTSLFYLSNHYDELGNYDESLKFAQRMEFETNGHRKDIPLLTRTDFNLMARFIQLYRFCNQERFGDAVKKAADIGDDLNKLGPSQFIIAKHYYSMALFYVGKYDAAAKMCEELQLDGTEAQEGERHLLLSSRLLLVMIHYSIKNYSVLPHFINSSATWAKRHGIKYPGAKEFFQWFRKLAKAERKEDQELLFRQLKKMIQKRSFNDLNKDLA